MIPHPTARTSVFEVVVIRQKHRPRARYGSPAPGYMPHGVLDCTFDAVLTMNRAGRIKQCNLPACRILGQPLERIIGKRLRDIVQLRPRSVPPEIPALPRSTGGAQSAMTLKRPNGSQLDVLVRECVGDDPHERVWIFRELSSGAMVAQALERQTRLLVEAQRVGKTGAWELDTATDVLIWTPELRRMMEAPEHIATVTVEQSFGFYSQTSEAIVREAFHAAISRGVPYDLELEVVTAKGTRLWVREVCRATIRDGRLVSVIGVLQDITERRRLADVLANVADQERARIGADLHDGLGQELTGLALLLQSLAARSRREGSALSGELRSLAQLASSSVASVRDMAHGMLPLALREGDFKGVLRNLARSTKRSFGIHVSVRFRGEKAHWPNGRVAEHLYRIAQESITNALKHGRAKHVSISVHGTAAKISMSVADDGIGCDVTKISDGTGLQIMRHRARTLGGLVDVQRAPNRGMRILCVVPQST